MERVIFGKEVVSITEEYGARIAKELVYRFCSTGYLMKDPPT